MTEWTIYNNRMPTYLLTEEELAALKAHEGSYEYYSFGSGKLGWRRTYSAVFHDTIVYRAVKEPEARVEVVKNS